jgi:hypothetical protein
MDEQEKKQVKKRRGCLFYAFLMGSFLLLFVVVGVLAAMRSFFSVTDKAPVPVPEVKMSQAEIDKVQKRVDAFREAVRGHQAPPPLLLTADEINALIKNDPDLESLKGKLYVTGIEGNEIKTQFSVSMAELGAAKFKDRYFNGYATLKPRIAKGRLRLDPVKVVTLRNRPFPERYLEIAKNLNFASSLNKNPRVYVALDWIEGVEVKDGKLVIIAKQNPP